jgi:hypothetical protein
LNSKLWKKNPNISSDKIAFRQGIASDVYRTGYSRLCSFAKQTLTRLIDAEQLAYGHMPSISLFCRMDIGIMENKETGNLDYFVNEISRGPTVTCLWGGLNFDTMSIPGNLGADFGTVFYRFLVENYPSRAR